MDKSYEITSRNIGPDINKASGSTMRADIFSNPHYENISAVLFSNVDAANSTEAMGYDFIAVHNPLACKPLPSDFLNFGCEFGAKLSRGKITLSSKDWQREVQQLTVDRTVRCGCKLSLVLHSEATFWGV